VRGLSPGTAPPSPSVFWPPRKDRPSAATIVLRSNVRMLRVNFILLWVGVWRDETKLWWVGEDDWRFGGWKVAGRN
jgi:hypothetical protein